MSNKEREQSTPEEIRAIAISGLKPFMNDFFDILNGDSKEFKSDNAYVIENSMDIAKGIIKTAGDLKIIEATNTAEVIKALNKGRITLAEAKDLMYVMTGHFEMTDLKDIMSKLDT